MAKACSYAVQVSSGREGIMCNAIMEAARRVAEADDDALADREAIQAERAGRAERGERQAEHAEHAEHAERASHSLGISECYSPLWQTQEKRNGQWRTVERRLLPGYIIVVASDPGQLARAVNVARAMPETGGFARVVGTSAGFTPLAEAEVRWLDRVAGRQTARTAPISTGVKEGDRVVITSGPLLNLEFPVVRIDRRRSTAYVEVDFLGRKKQIPLGLRILAKSR